MESFIALLVPLGYVGMGIASFIAGSFFPFSSEAILTALLVAGLKPFPLLCFATVGNVLGSMFNYWLGTFGREDWVYKYLRVRPERFHRAQRWVQHRGAWIGVFCFVPIVGSALAVTLGFMRANPYISFLSIFIGKLFRYTAIVLIFLSVA